MNPRSSTALALFWGVLGAGAFIAAGLFFGLRECGTDRSAAFAPARAPDPAADTARRAAALEDTRRFLESQRPGLSERCLRGGKAPHEPPNRGEYLWNFTFGADGRQLARGVNVKKSSHPAVDQCLALVLVSAQIPAPGTSVYVEVPFQFP